VISPFANEFDSVLPSDKTQEFMRIPEQLGLEHFLQANPLKRLSFVKQVFLDAKPLNGLYNYRTREAEISITRLQSDYGKQYQKQKIWSISTAARDADAAIQRTFVHELGHHLHCVLRQVDLMVFRSTMLTPISDSITQYGLVNSQEHFAESFAAFVFQRVELLMDNSFGYAMIQSVLERLELEIKELP
jgi:hypothetical protein